MSVEVIAMTTADLSAVQQIYAEGIATGVATFETQVPDLAGLDHKFLPHCRLVAKVDAEIVGWTALVSVSPRQVYAGVNEVMLYVSASRRGNGVGKALLQALITESEAAGIWMLQAVVLAENTASIQLHQSCGFRVVGRRERIGFRDGIWHDTILLERRSPVVGV